jgi:hypothetical protein
MRIPGKARSIKRAGDRWRRGPVIVVHPQVNIPGSAAASTSPPPFPTDLVDHEQVNLAGGPAQLGLDKRGQGRGLDAVAADAES